MRPHHRPHTPRPRGGRRLKFRPGVIPLEARELMTTIGLNFTGSTLNDARALTRTQFAPPDTMGAIGPNDFAELINGVFAVYDKSSGALVGSRISDTTFWSTKVGIGADLSAGLTDPRILYDPASRHWFATEVTAVSTGNLVLLGRSDTADPTGTWQGVSFVGDAGLADGIWGWANRPGQKPPAVIRSRAIRARAWW